MPGRSTSAVITFEGPRVPFYAKLGCTLSHCRRYKTSVQYCRSCEEIGYRQDVCPNPNDDIFDNCGEQNADPNNHKCELEYKLCGMPHETASREYRWKLKPAPPPLRVSQRMRPNRKGYPDPSRDRDRREEDGASPEQRQRTWSPTMSRSR
ncbi:hypothetical protein HPB52_004991 [Rhipicephalus sanguineus]|uniref:Uncharacterized protein n=1 Tax=Rhipicephalus sanguineus TaxID=34632 RepID=A0A9D4T555_RHISA|nr:hypothetical protein HPB52_004991 [Rhipicephalus sanguineus]